MKYDYIKAINSDKLIKELKTSTFKDKVKHIDSSFANGSVTVFVTEDLTNAEKTSLDSAIANHNTVDIQKNVEAAILKAQAFGNNLLISYGAKNVLAGKTNTEVDEISSRLERVQILLGSGSLYVALDKLDDVLVDELITQEDIDEVKGKLQAYLGL